MVAGPGEAAASEGEVSRTCSWAGGIQGQPSNCNSSLEGTSGLLGGWAFKGNHQIVIPLSEGTAGHGSNHESGTLPLTMPRAWVAQERGPHCPEVAPAFSGSISVPYAKIVRGLWALSSLDLSWAPSGATDTGNVCGQEEPGPLAHWRHGL